MEWRLGLAFFFLLVLLTVVLLLAYGVIPAIRTLPDTSLEPSLRGPLYGQIPETTLSWTKLPWGEETQVHPMTKKYPQLEVDASGNLLYPLN